LEGTLRSFIVGTAAAELGERKKGRRLRRELPMSTARTTPSHTPLCTHTERVLVSFGGEIRKRGKRGGGKREKKADKLSFRTVSILCVYG